MSDSREIWFVRTRYTHPTTWQGWLATIAFAAFVILMVILAAVIAATAFVIAVAVAVFLIAYAYLRFVFRHSRGSRDLDAYRGQNDA